MQLRILVSQFIMLLLILSVGATDVQAEAATDSLNDIASSDQTAHGAMAETLELFGRWYGGPVYASAVQAITCFLDPVGKYGS